LLKGNGCASFFSSTTSSFPFAPGFPGAAGFLSSFFACFFPPALAYWASSLCFLLKRGSFIKAASSSVNFSPF